MFLIKNFKSFCFGERAQLIGRFKIAHWWFYQCYQPGIKNWLGITLQPDTANCWHNDIELLYSTRKKSVRIFIVNRPTDLTSLSLLLLCSVMIFREINRPGVELRFPCLAGRRPVTHYLPSNYLYTVRDVKPLNLIGKCVWLMTKGNYQPTQLRTRLRAGTFQNGIVRAIEHRIS